MSLLSRFVRLILPIPKLSEQQSFAFIGPHPDDLEIACGGTIAKFVREGKRVCYIIATEGGYGSEDLSISREELAATRRRETLESAKLLGVTDVRFLDFPDGGEYSIERLKDKMCLELADFKPDIIFAPDNHLRNEIHPDHINTGRAAEIALMHCASKPVMRDLGMNETASPKGIAYYYTDMPNTYVKMNKYFKLKKEALCCHKSQFLFSEEAEKNFKGLLLYLKFSAVRQGIKRFSKGVEGFRVLANVHTHCAPEASKV